MKASTGLFLTGGQAFFAQPLILNIYGVMPEPESANDAAIGVLLVSVKDVHFVATGNGYRKAPGEIWLGKTEFDVALDTTYFRLVTAADHSEASTTFPRVQGSAGARLVSEWKSSDDWMLDEEDSDYSYDAFMFNSAGEKRVTFTEPDLYLPNPTIYPGQLLTIDGFEIVVGRDE
jgi:hypothetical protein